MDNTTIIGQGTFTANSTGLVNPNTGVASTSNAVAAYIKIPSNADWISVRNYTKASVAGTNAAYFNGVADGYVGLEHYWQRGMPAGSALVKFYNNASQALWGDTLTAGGFTLYDPSGQSAGAQPLLGPAIPTTQSSDQTRVVVNTANTNGVSVGTVVRMSNTAQTDINGMDFVVGAVTAGVSITLLTATNPLANIPGAVGGAGFYRIVYNANNALFYPRNRIIVNITQATNAQVSTSVAHGLTPGQEIRFNIPIQSGMTQLNPQLSNNYFPLSSPNAAIVQTIVDDYNFTININTTTYSLFTWPTIAQQPSSFPSFTPIGEDTSTSLLSNTAQVPTIGGVKIFDTNTQYLADSTVNTGYLGMVLDIGGTGTILGAPIIGPAGSISWSAGNVATGDTMYWVAGKSTYGGL
jgi:hypothetical protein